MQTDLRECFREWRIAPDGPRHVDTLFDKNDKEFLEWQASPQAAELRRREKLWEERVMKEEAERKGKKKRVRRTKKQIEEAEALASGKGTGGGAGGATC